MNTSENLSKRRNDVNNILANVPSSFLMSNNHFAEILLAGKINIWEFDLIKNEIIDFGYSESLSIRDENDQGLGNLDNFFARLHPRDLYRVKFAFEISLQTREDFESEYRVRLTNGYYEWVEARGRCIMDHNNVPVKMVGTWRFITNEKKAQEMMRSQQAALNRLSRAYFVGELASTIVHEISQPILAINAYISASLRRLKTNDITTSELINALEVSEYQLRTINKIIERIKSFIIDGDMKKEQINIHMLVKGAIKLIRFSHGKTAEIKLELEDNLPVIEADYYQIKQVLYSIINNAIEAMNAEAVIMPKILLRVNIENNMLNICVIDNGPGIQEDTKQWLFMPFFTSKEDGMGFGLAICRNIIKAHGGTLNIHQYEEQGAICCLRLPFSKDKNNDK